MPTRIYLEKLQPDGSWVLHPVSTSVYSVVRQDTAHYRLAHNDRDEAFQEFKRHIETVHDEYEAVIDGIGKKNGSEYMDKLLQDVKENYYEKYSQINLDKKQITAKGFETIRQLITEEISFVKKEL
jgi:hypothetical protein